MSKLDPAEVEKFIHWAGTYLGRPQVSLKPIRDRQDPGLTASLQSRAIAHLEREGNGEVSGRSYFAGSVDFMIRRKKDERRLFILESNGGSSRGYAILPADQWGMANDSYLETLNWCRSDPLVLITHPTKDLLFYEKAFLADDFSQALGGQARCPVIHVGAFKGQSSRPLVVVGSYAEALPRLSLSGDYACLDGVPVDVMIGDGLARRHTGIRSHLLDDSLETLVVNDIFHITDDKSITYEAVREAQDLLKPYGIVPISSWRAHTREELEDICRNALTEFPELVIKPHGGSGGAGIDLVVHRENIHRHIEESVRHYHDKFGPKRDPFPYTVCERVDATPAEWRDSLRQFDIRIYMGRRGSLVLPLGALCRIAIEPFAGKFTRKTFVVNLSGYGGVDTDRGLGISKDSLATLGLREDDFFNMFCAASALMAYISRNAPRLRRLAAEKARVGD